MIWFACKQCGKTHGRPESSAGALVFCECGNGNLVPWESTVPEPATQPVELPAGPDLEPVTFQPEPQEPTPAPAASERPRRGRIEKRDPERCFNHQSVPRTGVCDDCDEAFCADCLTTLQEATLCGPCKNFRARRMELPPLNSSLATASLVLALLSGPLAMCLLGWIHSPGVRWLAYLALMPELIALALGIWALRIAEQESKPGGQSLAITGVAMAALMFVLTILLNIYVARAMI
jgi:hypothetical protein